MIHDEPVAGRSLPAILIPASDYDRLEELAGTAPAPLDSYIQRELVRAQIVADADFDPSAARIGSRVTYREEPGGHTRVVTLVWPEQADLGTGRISVITAIGAALLGMRPGSCIEWIAPLGGARSLTVMAVESGNCDGAGEA